MIKKLITPTSLFLILFLLVLQSCQNKAKKTIEIENDSKSELIEANAIPNEFKSLLRPSEKIKLGKPYTDTAKKNEFNLLDTVLKTLNIKKENCKLDLVTSKENPSNTEETIVVIPEIVNEGEDYFEFNSHIVIVNTKTGEITHKYFESSKTNQWVSDALVLREITIDTAPYNVTDDKRAFGIRVRYVGSSQVNPYENETISLFIKSENVLKNILKNYVVINSNGRWDADCIGEFIKHKKVLIITANKTNGYFDILIKSKITEKTIYEDENGDCDSKENSTTVKTVLKHDGKEYKSVL